MAALPVAANPPPLPPMSEDDINLLRLFLLSCAAINALDLPSDASRTLQNLIR